MAKPRVSISKCATYDQAQVSRAVAEAVGHLGGIGGFVSPGDRVFLKVNLLMPKAPEEAVTTHPAVVRAAIHLIESAGGKVVVGDSPAMGYTRARLEKCYRKSQMCEAVEGTGAELNWDFETVRVSNPDGRRIKSIEYVKAAEDADRIVSLPKLKTHSFAGFTGGVKIHFGLIPGYTKAAFHTLLPDPGEFSEMLLDVAYYAKPSLIIMDGVVGMDGPGPSGGNPRQVGAILAAQDPVAMDVVATTMVKMEPMKVPVIERAVARGISTGSIDGIDVIGASLDDFAGVRFEHEEARAVRVPRFAMRAISRRWMKRPKADPARCVACGDCARMCPQKCIGIKSKGKGKPVAVMDYKKCIRCYCCHEVCPEKAIDLV
jgi:uncharacterized protein (DUF362 family)/NAD-dependent dihydropyrimidine dehydrogenase PreA subunit